MTPHLVTPHGLLNRGCLVCGRRHMIPWADITLERVKFGYYAHYACDTYLAGTGGRIPVVAAELAIAGGASVLGSKAWDAVDQGLFELLCVARAGEGV